MTSASNDNGQSAVACPICNKPPTAEYAPFCCKRCADIDLHRWLSGSYAIPATDEDSDEPGVEPDEPA
ncbi:DNA gyrase inhibitor YacG [Hyphococcus sp.]|uniref:DNA gyrase inhibitor YacG n=1 Tax=Hyphococcus sp. TaxID=2038636 RepID=UPI002083273E|nr:MAG: DNA gyrase inhibitor YacG [Marinicaulis sp.]